MQPNTYKHFPGFKSLIAYILYQALVELKDKNETTRNEAKEFLLSEDSEFFCYVLGIDHEIIKDIDFDNPSNSLNFNVSIREE